MPSPSSSPSMPSPKPVLVAKHAKSLKPVLIAQHAEPSKFLQSWWRKRLGSEPEMNGDETTSPDQGETGEPGAPGDSASSEDLINAGEALLEAASDLTRGAQGADDPLLPEPMSDASGGEPEDALIPESEPTQPADEETFFKLTQRAPVLRQQKPRLKSTNRTSHLRRARNSRSSQGGRAIPRW